MSGIAALGMPRGLALAVRRGFLNAKGSGIGNDRMPVIAALGMTECPSLRHWCNLGGP